MPRYDYTCDYCDMQVEEWATISQYQEEIMCTRCGGIMHRDFSTGPPATLDAVFHKPIEMYSVAPETPAELAAFRRRNPDVQLNDQFVPMARSRAEKLRILKAEGFEEKN